MQDNQFKIKIKWWYVLLILAVPIIINFLAKIKLDLAVGNGETWVGFFANYAGGLVGALIAIIIANSQGRMVLEQMKQEQQRIEVVQKENEDQRIKEEQEKRDIGIKIVERFLHDEISFNLRRINPAFFECMKEIKNRGPVRNYRFDHNFKYNDYDHIKFEIIKYNEQRISDTFDLYAVLRRIEGLKKIDAANYMDIMTPEEAGYILKNLEKWEMDLFMIYM
ncbi:hypothetical protein ACFWMP_13990 [Paenibacillus sp. NPDC058367]|uniref:hypothetical protein n=1 Tax=Paenibacillus sp. NPDC058367 TaxID=3346460 RepID=UPI0036609C7B